MSGWYVVNLGDALLSQSMLSELKLQLTQVYEREGKPGDLVALYRHESQGLHCDIKIYLTAEFQRVAKLPDAVSCTEPGYSDTGFLAGNSEYP
jgi:hypothetical protein